MRSRAAGLLLGYAADQICGDPRRFHPVAGFGTLAAGLEACHYDDSRRRGVAHVLVLVGGAAGLSYAAERHTGHPLTRTALTAAVTWTVLGGRSLEREAHTVHGYLAAGDLRAARSRVRHLVGRDTTALNPDEIARAVVESVAENASDAVVTALLWGAVAGVAGLVAHRTANTLDAMIGHRNARYERFGWAAARLDDLLGLPASRLSATLVVVMGPDRAGALAAWRRDARRHPSPNAGVAEAAFAGALGLRLGGTNVYDGGRREDRAVLGFGRPPTPADIPQTVRLARRVGIAAALAAAAFCLRRAPRKRDNTSGTSPIGL